MRRNMTLRLLTTATIFVIALIFSGTAWGQVGFTAALRGEVQDPQQAAVPGAVVTITNDATGVSDKTTTDGAGRYIFTALQPSTYTISVEAQGFKSLIRSGVTLRVGQQTDLPLTLQVGAVSTAITVAGTAPLLDTNSSSLGTAVDNKFVTEVPLFERDVAHLVTLAAGVTQPGTTAGNSWVGYEIGSNYYTNNNFISNGQVNSTAQQTLDGATLTYPEGDSGAEFTWYEPTPELLQEFKVQNSNYSAAYGNNGGTTITMVSKSGTNKFHGTVYDFFRRPSMDAQNFFANRSGLKKTPYVRDTVGGAVGGPVIKNRTFFYFLYEKNRASVPTTVVTTVPTALQKSGDFSQTFNADGTLKTIYNPFSVSQAGDGTYTRAGFADNQIPANLMDPVALNLLKYWPDPTSAGDPITGLNNFTVAGVQTQPNFQTSLKIDHRISDKQSLSGRYTFYRTNIHYPGAYHNDYDYAWTRSVQDQNGFLQHSWTINPTTVWTNLIGGTRDLMQDLPLQQGLDQTALGFSQTLGQIYGPGLPIVSVSGMGQLGGGGIGKYGRTVMDMHSSLAKIVGGHSLKFGFDRRWILNNYVQPGAPWGLYNFGAGETAQTPLNPSTASQGYGLASLLLGWTSGGVLTNSPGTTDSAWETGFYAQDDWKVTRRLTLNLGLRYEWSTPRADRFNNLAIPDYNLDSGINVPGLGELHGGIVQLIGRVPSDKNNFAPRLGLAYSLGDKTVLRAGAGVFYGIDPMEAHYLTAPNMRRSASINGSLDSGLTRYATLENPWPECVSGSHCDSLDAQGWKYGKAAMWGYGAGTYPMEARYQNADIFQWNFSVQHQLTSSLMVQVAYVGMRSNHLVLWDTNRNFITTDQRAQYSISQLATQVANPFYPLFVGPDAIFNEPASAFSRPTTALSNLLVQYPQFPGGLGGLPALGGNSSYNALQISFEKRYTAGLTFTGNYTRSSLKDAQSMNRGDYWLGAVAPPQDMNNYLGPGEYGTSGGDTPNRVVLGVNYDLPLGRGRHFGSAMNRALDAVVGGWQVTGLLTLQSGLPLNIGLSPNRLSGGRQRPNISGDPRSSASTMDVVNGTANFFNVSAFSAPEEQQLGNSPRYNGALRSDGINTIDMGIFKNFKFSERMTLQVRGEFFNFTNTPQFGPPGATFGTTSFGTINMLVNGPRMTQIGIKFLF